VERVPSFRPDGLLQDVTRLITVIVPEKGVRVIRQLEAELEKCPERVSLSEGEALASGISPIREYAL
jgi:hypothetical protein